MQNLEVLACKLTELWQKSKRIWTDGQTDQPTDICITRAPMELKTQKVGNEIAHIIEFCLLALGR